MAEKYAKQQQPVVRAKFALEYAAGCLSALMLSQWSAFVVLVTLTFDLLTSKLVASRIRGGEPSFRIWAR